MFVLAIALFQLADRRGDRAQDFEGSRPNPLKVTHTQWCDRRLLLPREPNTP